MALFRVKETLKQSILYVVATLWSTGWNYSMYSVFQPDPVRVIGLPLRINPSPDWKLAVHKTVDDVFVALSSVFPTVYS